MAYNAKLSQLREEGRAHSDKLPWPGARSVGPRRRLVDRTLELHKRLFALTDLTVLISYCCSRDPRCGINNSWAVWGDNTTPSSSSLSGPRGR